MYLYVCMCIYYMIAKIIIKITRFSLKTKSHSWLETNFLLSLPLGWRRESLHSWINVEEYLVYVVPAIDSNQQIHEYTFSSRSGEIVFQSNTVKLSGIRAHQVPGYIICVITMSDVTGPDGLLAANKASAIEKDNRHLYSSNQPSACLTGRCISLRIRQGLPLRDGRRGIMESLSLPPPPSLSSLSLSPPPQLTKWAA